MSEVKVKRATLEELQEFANKIREAGGGNPIDALMPAVPTDVSQCLIAKNLNFNCTVGAVGEDGWWMAVDDKETRDKIAEALNLTASDYYYQSEEMLMDDDGDFYYPDEVQVYAVKLPDEIGQVAEDFDTCQHAITSDYNWKNHQPNYSISPHATNEEIANLKEFWPYIDASIKEAFANAPFVNEKGELII